LQLKSVQDITRAHRHIFLSSHLDDAVYACGGTLGVQVSSGLRPLVITVFAGIPAADTTLSPFAQEHHRRWGADPTKEPGDIIEKRRQEDAAALDYLQADYLWLDYPEAIYRGTPAYYNNNNQLMATDVPSEDSGIDKHLAEVLLELQDRLPDAVWYAPLGIGHHVDHQIVCSAADRLVQRGAKVYFYEDFPYVTRAGALEHRLKELGTPFEPNLVEMSEYLPARTEASKMYTSQVLNNFSSEEELEEIMSSYTRSIRPVETIRLERYWSARP
jgi:LmbE family N-acetylglucosaminyl deacetylase